MFKLLNEISHLKEATGDEKFLDKVWNDLIKLGVEESRIEKAFSGRGAGIKIEDVFQELADDLSDRDKMKDKSSQKVAKTLATRFKNFFKPTNL